MRCELCGDCKGVRQQGRGGPKLCGECRGHQPARCPVHDAALVTAPVVAGDDAPTEVCPVCHAQDEQLAAGIADLLVAKGA